MKLGAVIIVYNPDINSLISHVEKLIKNIDTVILYQNSLIDDKLLSNLFSGKITIIGDGRNVGIGEALNSAITILKEKDFTHVLSLDQDSYFKEGHLSNFIKLVEDFKDDTVGVFAPNYNNRGELLFDNTKEIFEDSDAITSGSIIPLDVFDLAGGFNSDLFIDTVDQEFCYRIKSTFGLKTIIFPAVELIHELGYPLKIIFGLTTQNYSSFRTYYLVRNHIFLWKKYPKLYKKEYKNSLLKNYIFYRIIKIILGETDKINKIKSIIKGISHGFSMKHII